jgi:hypothetical protein
MNVENAPVVPMNTIAKSSDRLKTLAVDDILAQAYLADRVMPFG